MAKVVKLTTRNNNPQSQRERSRDTARSNADVINRMLARPGQR